tara:strand:+ start:77 stop:544 length:468 start_codon:yes stop_codon:yes gene_type:complete
MNIDERYKNGKLYKIINPIDYPGEKYYGSTIKELEVRLSKHKYRRSCRASKLINGNEEIILIQNYPCNNKKELEKRERWFIEKFECINRTIPGRTKNEYIEANKEKVAEEGKIKIDCECGLKIRKRYYYQHKKTKKHQLNIDELNISGQSINPLN